MRKSPQRDFDEGAIGPKASHNAFVEAVRSLLELFFLLRDDRVAFLFVEEVRDVYCNKLDFGL